MKIALLTKSEYNENSPQVKLVKNELFNCGIEVLPLNSNIDDADVVIAIGGDGTIFHTAAIAMWKNKPVLGINAGRLGFLAQLELDDLSPIKQLANGNYSIEKRLVLKASVGSETYYAVNDFVISHSGFGGRVYDIEVSCNEHLVGSYRADGLIFATPTGSTAYSVSAGGPIADPTINCIIMTPIASHSLISRSIVFSDVNKLKVKSPKIYGNDFNLVCDGKLVGKLKKDTSIIIEKAEVTSSFICLNGRAFIDTLNDKMKRRG